MCVLAAAVQSAIVARGYPDRPGWWIFGCVIRSARWPIRCQLEVTDRFDLYPDGVAGEVGDRHLVHLHDLDAVGPMRTSVVVPPMSTTAQSARPDRNAAPRIEFAGPEAKIATGSGVGIRRP